MSVSDIIEGMQGAVVDDGGGNYIQLYEGLEFAKLVISTVAGYLIVALLIAIPLVVSIEVIYINFPTFQSAILKLTEGNKRLEGIVGLCLRDARLAITRANTKETGRSANGEYLMIKMKVIIVAIFIVALASGGINNIITFMVSWLKKILG